MIYRTLKWIMRYAANKYFVDIAVLNPERIPADKPVLLLPNHRSAFMDPVIVATQIKRKVFFLARGESFESPLIARLFKQMNMIPVYRKDYMPEKVGQNNQIFEHCYQLMEQGGALMVFPEGICQTKYLLAPLKVGSSKIALEAEARNDFGLDVHMVPIGINYTNPHRFRGKVTINIGEPLRTADYKEAYRADAWKTVDSLTANLEEALRNLVVVLDDQEEINTIYCAEKLVENSGTLLDQMDWYSKRQALNTWVNKYKRAAPSKYEILSLRLKQHFNRMERLRIRRNIVRKKEGENRGYSFGLQTLILLLGFPVFLLGFGLHILPFVLTMLTAKLVVKRVDFMGSILFAMGLMFFTLFGIFESWLLFKFTQSWYITLAFAFVWPPLGLLTYGYLSDATWWFDRIKWYRLGKRRSGLKQTIAAERETLIQDVMKSYNEHVATN